jgi:hypothetical protein
MPPSITFNLQRHLVSIDLRIFRSEAAAQWRSATNAADATPRPISGEDAQIVTVTAEGLCVGTLCPRAEAKGEARRTRSDRKLATRHPVSHPRLPPLEVTQEDGQEPGHACDGHQPRFCCRPRLEFADARRGF